MPQAGTVEDTPPPPGYRVDWEADVVLRDGSVTHVRPMRPTDGDRIRTFHAGQSEQSIYFRYFAPLRELSDRDIERFTVLDYVNRVALVATTRDEIIGIGRYDRLDPTTAEIAFNILDSYQGKGVGSVLLEHLSAIGRDAGIQRFVAEVLPQNRKMINVFKEAGYAVEHRLEDGIIELSFEIRPTARSRAVQMSREHRAESLSVRSMLYPNSVAVIGASRRDDAIGHRFLENILAAGFRGAVYAVNPASREVLGLDAYESVVDIPGPVDLAVIAVPAEKVLPIVRDCATKGVRTLIVTSGNFAETGAEGAQRQEELRQRARRDGMRLIGPVSFGIINNNRAVRLNASLAPDLPPVGTLGLFAQSGALGIAVLASAARRNLGVSSFASVGNRVDVSGNDFMQYWIDDPDTDAVGLYVESMGNPRKFFRIARHLSRTKPVMLVKSGVSSFSMPPGHLVRHTPRPAALDSMLTQAGVIRSENIHQLFDVAQLLLHQPMPAGDRVAVVTNSVALSSITADAALSWGLQLTHGPVTISASCTVEEFGEALRAAFEDDEVDSVLACYFPPVPALDEEVVAMLSDEALRSDKPCAATFLGMRGLPTVGPAPGVEVRQRAVPVYGMPEDAVRALAAATRYALWRSRDPGQPLPTPGIDVPAAQQVIDTVLEDEPAGRALTVAESSDLLQAYGIRLWTSHTVRTCEAALAAADDVGYPVVLKATTPALRHQPGHAGLRLDLTSPKGLQRAWQSLVEAVGDPAITFPFVVAAQATRGVSCVVGTAEDPLFGPVVSFSLAGPPTELLDDIAYGIPPLTDVDVRDLVNSVRAAPLLTGYRGAEPVDLDALYDLITRLSKMADDHPQLARVQLTPVNARPSGLDVLGAEIEVHSGLVRADIGRRAMTT